MFKNRSYELANIPADTFTMGSSASVWLTVMITKTNIRKICQINLRYFILKDKLLNGIRRK